MSEKEKYEKLLRFVKDLVNTGELNSGESNETTVMRWYVTIGHAKSLLNEIEER